MNAISPTRIDPTKIRDHAVALDFIRMGIQKGDEFRDYLDIDLMGFLYRLNALGLAITKKDKSSRTVEEQAVVLLMSLDVAGLRRMTMADFNRYLKSAKVEQSQLSATFAETESVSTTPNVENDDFAAILSMIPANTPQNIQMAQNRLPSGSGEEQETRRIILRVMELKHQRDNRIVTTNPMLRQQNNQRQAEAEAKLNALSEALNARPRALALIREVAEQLNEALDTPLSRHRASPVDTDDRPRQSM